MVSSIQPASQTTFTSQVKTGKTAAEVQKAAAAFSSDQVVANKIKNAVVTTVVSLGAGAGAFAAAEQIARRMPMFAGPSGLLAVPVIFGAGGGAALGTFAASRVDSPLKSIGAGALTAAITATGTSLLFSKGNLKDVVGMAPFFVLPAAIGGAIGGAVEYFTLEKTKLNK